MELIDDPLDVLGYFRTSAAFRRKSRVEADRPGGALDYQGDGAI